MENKKIFILRLISFSVGPVVGSVVSFASTAFTMRALVPEEFGRYSMFVVAQSALVLVLYFGYDQAYAREFNAEKNKGKLLANAGIVPFILSIVLAVGIFIFSRPISKVLFNVDSSLPSLLLALILPFLYISRFSELTIRMEERARLYSIVTIFSKSLSLALVIALLSIKKSYQYAIGAYFIAILITAFVYRHITRKTWPKHLPKFDLNQIKNLSSFAIPLVPANAIAWLLGYFGIVFLRIFSTYEEVGIFSGSLRVASILGIVQQAFVLFWVPTAYRWNEENINKESYLSVAKLVCGVLSLIYVVLFFARAPIVSLLGHSYESIFDILPFAFLPPMFYTISEVFSIGIVFVRKTYLNIVVSILSASISVFSGLLMIPRFGAMGASISAMLGYWVFWITRMMLARKVWYRFSSTPYLIYAFLLPGCALASIGRAPYALLFVIMLTIVSVIDIYRWLFGSKSNAKHQN